MDLYRAFNIPYILLIIKYKKNTDRNQVKYLQNKFKKTKFYQFFFKSKW